MQDSALDSLAEARIAVLGELPRHASNPLPTSDPLVRARMMVSQTFALRDSLFSHPAIIIVILKASTYVSEASATGTRSGSAESQLLSAHTPRAVICSSAYAPPGVPHKNIYLFIFMHKCSDIATYCRSIIFSGL